MRDFILHEMDELQADGVDFVAFTLDEDIPQIYCSYTKEEFKNIEIIPKSNYKYWLITNGIKKYINND